MQSLQYGCAKSYGYRKTEVYNPAKARRLEVQFQQSAPLTRFPVRFNISLSSFKKLKG
jgi:hypothetical protein